MISSRLASPSVSVIVPAYNEAAWLPHSLAALVAQDYPGAFELIVVDNGSSDQTVLVAKAHGARVVSEPRLGVAYAREAGFRAARGDLLLTTDADTLVPVDWLTNLVRLFDQHPEAVGVGGPVSYAMQDPLQRQLFETVIPLLHELDRWVHEGRGHLVGANLAVRRTAYLALDGFRTELTLGEDLDFSHRLAQLGPVIFAPQVRVVTSDRRFRSRGPQMVWRYFQNYLTITKPSQSMRAKITRAFEHYRRELGRPRLSRRARQTPQKESDERTI